jgi:hypothetical protein
MHELLRPAGASHERCTAFSEAFNEVRGEDDEKPVDRAAALKDIAKICAALTFSDAEVAYYLETMAKLNFIMLAEDKIYII